MQTWNKPHNRYLLCCYLDVRQISTISPGLHKHMTGRKRRLSIMKQTAKTAQTFCNRFALAQIRDESDEVSWHTDSSVKNGCDWLCDARHGNSEGTRQAAERKKKNLAKSFYCSHFHMHWSGVWEQTAERLLCHLMRRKVKLQLLVLSVDGNTCCFESELSDHFSNYETLLWMYWRLHFELFLYLVLQVCAHISSLFYLPV